MNLKNYFLLYLIAIPAIAFCQKNITSEAPVLKPETDVYVVGTVTTANINSVAAAYWKNGVCTKLSDSLSLCYGTGIAVKGNDVYVSGNYDLGNFKSMPTYWKNGVEKKLPYDGASEATATGIAVNTNGDVYVAGYTIDTNSKRTAVYWKNGHEVVALAPDVFSEADAVAINETGIYFAGSSMTPAGKLEIVYWRNGMVTNLSNSMSIVNGITAIAMNRADVYIAGAIVKKSTNFSAVYWKHNGESITLRDGRLNSLARAIAVNNNDVYVAGYSDNGTAKSTATYWKNGTSINLIDGAYAYAITLTGDDVYIAGATTDYKAVYWKNGVINYLSGGIDAKGIVVVKRQ